MRWAIAIIMTAMLAMPASAAPGTPLRPGELASAEAVQTWINGYRAKREIGHVPAAVDAMSRLGAFRDPENAGVYIGFLAGILGSHPERAEAFVAQMLTMPPEDHWAVVRAVAYSGLPDWKALLTKFSGRMPTRKLMIDKYLAGQLPTLDQIGFPKSPGAMDKLREAVTFNRPAEPRKNEVLEPSPSLLDTLWGYYFATGAYAPAISRIVVMLPLSQDRDNVEKLTLGMMAKYTLATNAARDPKLLSMLKHTQRHHPKKTTAVLKDVIEAAETVETARLRRDALAAVDELKRKGPGYKRDISFWGQVGEGAIALGCIAAAVTGQVELGLPCVVGGAVSSAALRAWNAQ